MIKGAMGFNPPIIPMMNFLYLLFCATRSKKKPIDSFTALIPSMTTIEW